MKIGIFIFATSYAMRIADLARAAEARGFESLFVPEHTHIPASRRSAWPGGADLPKEYWHTLDPFVALMAAAAATTTLRVGTGICLLTERDPLVTAKAVASLDMLSNGRAELGIGAGWNAEEMENHGTAFKTRFAVMGERARAIKALWTEPEPEFHGQFVDFDKVWSYPNPCRSRIRPSSLAANPSIPCAVLCNIGDGWFPRARRGFDAAANVARLRAVADEANRDMATLSISVFGRTGGCGGVARLPRGRHPPSRC